MPELAARSGALLGAAAALVALVVFAATVGGAFPGLLLLAPAAAAYLLGSYAPHYPGLAGAIALTLAVVVVDTEPVPAVLLTVAPWILGALVRARRDLVRRLAERAAELEQEERRLADLTARRERVRMAAELHHLVGHHLAVVVVQAGAGRLVAADDRAAAAQYLSGIRLSAQEALVDIERVGAALAPDGRAEVAERLARIIDRVRASGVAAELRGAPPPYLADEVGEHATQIVQEALTNVVKHAPGARAIVDIALEDDHLRIVVENAGGGGGAVLAGSGSGLGLVALAAEAEALGGRLAAGPTPGGGWRVDAALPLRPAVIPVG